MNNKKNVRNSNEISAFIAMLLICFTIRSKFEKSQFEALAKAIE